MDRQEAELSIDIRMSIYFLQGKSYRFLNLTHGFSYQTDSRGKLEGTFFRSIVHTLRYDRSKLRDCCASIGAIGAENVYPIIKEP